MPVFPVTTEGKLVGEKWRWETFTTDQGSCRFELYVPTTDEHLKMVTRFRIGERKADWSGCRKFIATHWIRDWEDVLGADRQPLDCTPETRAAVLEADKDLFDWVHEKVKAATQNAEAGNVASGTD